MTSPKETLLKIKELFNKKFDAPVPPTPAVDTTAPAPVMTAPVMYSWAVDGGDPVYVNCGDDGMEDIDSGDPVYTDDTMSAPYPDGDYKVTGTDFGFTVSGGAISAITDPDAAGPGPSIESGAAATQPDQTMNAEPATPPAPTLEQRIADLENKISKYEGPAGYVKEEELKKITEEIGKQDEVIKGLFELAEKLIEEPTAEPATLTGMKKEKFDRAAKREEKFKGILDALNKAKEKK